MLSDDRTIVLPREISRDFVLTVFIGESEALLSDDHFHAGGLKGFKINSSSLYWFSFA
jgi:hypothetical protein